MPAKGRILVVDDLETWRLRLKEILERGGFHVDTAESIVDAQTKLKETFYHLLIQDVSMDNTVKNVDGLRFLERLVANDPDPNDRAMELIVLTYFPTMPAMYASLHNIKAANFLFKIPTAQGFDADAFVKEITHVFNTAVKVNLDLEIAWQGRASAREAVRGLWIGDDGTGERVRRDTPLEARMAEELDDLLRRLFYDRKGVIVTLLNRGYSGTGVVLAETDIDYLAAGKCIVKYGIWNMIKEEREKFATFVQPLGGPRTTAMLGTRRTATLGGIKYSFLGTGGQAFDNFGDFYHNHNVAQIRTVLKDLFDETCGQWYAHREGPTRVLLTDEYQKTLLPDADRLNGLQTDVDRLEKTVKGGKSSRLSFEHLSNHRHFTNPVAALLNGQIGQKWAFTYRCVTHGDFNHNNIFVDRDRHTWLIDFLRTGNGHILRDVAQLDSVIRHELLQEGEATLDERLQLEEKLLDGIDSFGEIGSMPDELDSENKALAKAYAATVCLRKIARKLVEHNVDAHIREYYVALLYYAINIIRFYQVPSQQREHALLTASLLIDHPAI